MNSGFRVKGWHVLAGVLGFFAITIAVNATFITFAVGTFSGLVVDEPYVRGLDYNDTLAARAEQDGRGWTATVAHARVPDGAVRIIVEIDDAAGESVAGLLMTATIGRAATASEDRELAFADAGGSYITFVEDLPDGEWELTVRTQFRDGAPFEARKRIIVS
jgi:nitrogen fixation protein FixH